MQLQRGFRLGRPLGVPLLVHVSWFPAAALLTSHFVLTVYADLSTPAAVAWGIVSTLAFFASLVAHELGHAVCARAIGIGVRDITLFVFGGVARIAREPSKPAQELVIAVAGPIVSVVLGGLLLVVAPGGDGSPGRLAWTIGVANLALAAFNLLPGFPLDGGRVLRALLWARSGDAHRATLRAGRTGQAIGVLLAIGGIGVFVSGTIGDGFLHDGGPEGLWLAVVGVFLHVLATAARRAAVVTSRLGAQTAGSWARPFGGTVAVGATVG